MNISNINSKTFILLISYDIMILFKDIQTKIILYTTQHITKLDFNLK